MICEVCGIYFEPKNIVHKYCTSKCRDFKRARSPARKENMKVWRRKSNLKIFYGLTLAEYNRMLEKQKGGCYLCGGKSRGNRPLDVDHCHKTGRVRGLLCGICNRHVIRDRDLEFFKRCVEYMSS